VNIRRNRPVVLGGALAALLVASAMPPFAPGASAAPDLEITLSTGSFVTGGAGTEATCQVSTTAPVDTREIPMTGGSASAASAGTQTVTDVATQEVVATGTTTSQVSATVDTLGGEFRSLTFTDNSSATMSAATPKACTGEKAYNYGGGSLNAVVAVSRPGWLEVTTTRGYAGDVEFRVMSGFFPGPDDANEHNELISYDHGTHTNRIFVPSGRIAIFINAYVYGSTFSDGTYSQSSSDASAVTATFTPTGEATGAAVGTARDLVALPDSVDCNAHRATVSITKKAKKKAKRIDVFVNGKKARTVKRIKRPTALTVAVPATGAVTVKVVLTRKPGKKKPTVARTYAPCG